MGSSKESEKSEMDYMLGKDVVIDTTTPLIYIGRLAEVGEHFITLEDVDVHDTTEGSSTKEVYCIDAKKFGIKKNRKRVLVVKRVVVSVSLLEDVIEY